MILELSKSDYKWFAEFLSKFQFLTGTHVLNGTRIENGIKAKISEILKAEVEGSGFYLIPLSVNQVEFFIDLLEENTCACPGCTMAGVKHRKSVTAKLYMILDSEALEG